MKKLPFLLYFLSTLAFAQNTSVENLEFEMKPPNVEVKPVIIESETITPVVEDEVLFVQELPPTVDPWQKLIQSKQKNYSDIKKMIDNGTSINKPVINTLNILHLAGMQNNFTLAQFAITNKASINTFNKNNETPLHWAAAAKNSDILNIEINSVPTKDIENIINKVNKDGKNALHFNAQYYGNLISTQLLINKNINVNLKDKNGQTPLQYALVNKKWQIADLLLKNGADFSSKDNNNLSGDDYLMTYGDIAGFALLYRYLNKENQAIILARFNGSRTALPT